MAEIQTIKAEARSKLGTGGARDTRRGGRIPAIVYGEKAEPQPVSVDLKEIDREIHKTSFFATLYEIEIDGKKQRVLPRDLQLDPVNDIPVHLDFMRVGKNTRLRVNVPVVAVNGEASPGLKRGGVLNIVRHEVAVFCRADNIPEKITIDLTGLDINDSVHISNVKLPDGVTPTIKGRDFAVATISPPTVQVEEVVAKPAEGAEGAAPAEGAAAAPAAGAAAPAAAAGGAAAKGAAPAAGGAAAKGAAPAAGGKKK
ncbi:MAG: 50S ribosomal protein L25/general stress protein Ctc [Alphaproteobacteria bacterium]